MILRILFLLMALPLVSAPPAYAAKRTAEIFLQTGHDAYIYSVSFSPDGKRIASGSSDRTVKLWDSTTGELLKILSGHDAYVSSVIFSPDGRRIASGSWDKTVKLWDSTTGELLKTLSGHDDTVYSASFSPDGRTIVSGSNDNSVKLWDSATGEMLKTLTGHAASVNSVCFSPDGRRIASGSLDNTVKLWDSPTGELLKTLTGHAASVNSVSFSPDSRRIASGSKDNTVRLWDSVTGELPKILSGHDASVNSVSFSPDGKLIASCTDDKTVKLWDSTTGKLMKTLFGHDASVFSANFSPDSRRIASGSKDNTVKLWDAETRKELFTLASLPGNEWIAFSSEPGRIYYNSSIIGDRYANIRFDGSDAELYPLKYYREQLKHSDLAKALTEPQPDIEPKRIRLLWDRLQNKSFDISGFLLTILMFSVSVMIIRFRRSDPLEISKRFFPKAGFKKIEKSGNLLLLHGYFGHITGAVSIWNAEYKKTYVYHLKHQIDSRVQNKEVLKIYIVYKGMTPPEPMLLRPLRDDRFEVIPISSERMEKALYNEKYGETLKELEEPFITRKDPYSESKPIHDPTWFYGRDEMMSRIPAVLAQGQHIVIFGLRKVGKTSLLKQIQQRFVNVPVAYIDCQGHSYSAVAYFEDILRQIYTELKMRKIGIISEPDRVSSPEDFQKQLMPMYEAWHKKGPEPFMIILDEIDKLFPSREFKNNEAILSEYVSLFKVLRSLAQSYKCLTTLVVAYRPHINRHNLLTQSVGENPMFKSFQEEYLGFLSRDDTKSMIQKIGMWKDIRWEDDAAARVFHYCGGHPLVSRYFASMACNGGKNKHIDLEHAENTAKEVIKTFSRNDIGDYYKEGIWALLTLEEQEVLSLICKPAHEPLLETHIPDELRESLVNVNRFGLVYIYDGKVCLTANLFDEWLKRRLV